MARFFSITLAVFAAFIPLQLHAVIKCIESIRVVGQRPGLDSHPVGRKVAASHGEIPIVQKKIWLLHRLQEARGSKEVSTGDGMIRAAVFDLPEVFSLKDGKVLVTNVEILWREGEIERVGVEFFDDQQILIAALSFAQDRDRETLISSFILQSASLLEPEKARDIFKFPHRAAEALRFVSSIELPLRAQDPDVQATVRSLSVLVPGWIFRPMLADMSSSVYGDRRIQLQISRRFSGSRSSDQDYAQMAQILPGARDWESLFAPKRMRASGDSDVAESGVEVLAHEVKLNSVNESFERVSFVESKVYIPVPELPSGAILIHEYSEDDEDGVIVAQVNHYLKMEESSGGKFRGRIFRRKIDADGVEVGMARIQISFKIDANGFAQLEILDELGEVLGRIVMAASIIDFKYWVPIPKHPTYGFLSQILDYQNLRGYLAQLPLFDKLIQPAVRAAAVFVSEAFEKSHLRGQ